MIPTGAGAAIGKAGAPDTNAGPNGAITPGPPHEGSRVTPEGRIISVPPDVCLTPRGSAMVPVPYKIWAYQKEATNLANTVLQTTLKSHVKGSIIRECYGDEAGTGGGIKSGTHNAECTPKTWSQTVLWEGRNAVRDSDEWWMNHENTWGVLDYKKDMGQYDTQASSQVDAKLYLAFAESETELPGGNMPPETRSTESEVTQPNLNYGTGAAGGTPPAEVSLQTAHMMYLQSLPSSSWREAGAYWQAPDGTLIRKDQFEWIMKTRPLTPSERTALGVVRQTGKKCPCIVGTYASVKPLCKSANCGGQAHHIVADKYLRLGTRPAPGAVDPNRIKGMPSLDDGPSICLNGNAGDEDTDHNIAHQNDGRIQEMGNLNKPQGTLPIGIIRTLSVDAAKAAAPGDPECQKEIDDATKIDNYGGDSLALVRSTNNPPAPDSEAMKYFRPPQPIQQ